MPVDAIVALIVAGTVFRTRGTWALTRLATIVVVVFAILLDFTPLGRAFAPAAPWVWTALLALWLVNVVSVARRVRSA